MSRALLTQWRKAYHLGLLADGPTSFSPVEIGPEPGSRQHPATFLAPPTEDRIEIVLANGRRLVLSASTPAATLARLVHVLERA